jgi:NAD(P)-dependent dehydrogenase (short-subunit alcohol dehydrogenase family)
MKKQNWSLEQVPDLTGKVIIVTGANSGLGFEATKVFAKNNATVVMACRNLERANASIQKIKEEIPNANLHLIQLDLSDLSTVDTFVESFKKSYSKLDVLLNNAGIMAIPYQLTKDGFETQNGVNHLGHFVLTSKLFDVLKSTKNSRIVNVASMAHKFGKMDFDNYLFEKGKYSKWRSYGRSKLSNLLFTYELDRRIKEQNIDIKVFAAHPGVSSTELGRYSKAGKLSTFFTNIGFSFAQPQSKGALPEIRACVEEDAVSGTYFGPSGFMELKGRAVIVKSNKRSHSLDDAKKLWDVSETLTKTPFNV